ncbi:MAG: type I-E CRISPR-associated protein Cas5/CasD [Gemmatimonadaceae bacterium]
MTDFLLATLYAPLASWGDIAVGEVRDSWEFPSRSAILGLLAGALGIEREEQSRHDALDHGLGVAVRADVMGSALVDYHTVQTVAAKALKKRPPATRRELLAAAPPETMVTRRTLRCEALYTIAVWKASEAGPTLTELAQALRNPTFVPYAGRKANAFALPFNAQVVQSASLAGALRERVVPELLGGRLPARITGPVHVVHDPCETFESELAAIRQVQRRDASPHRGRWQFAERTMLVGVMPEEDAR